MLGSVKLAQTRSLLTEGMFVCGPHPLQHSRPVQTTRNLTLQLRPTHARSWDTMARQVQPS